ncbi:MAG TPA: hypothetical protein VGO50_18880, partial [Pyrinomonadaceae bacterium]|nr:hypothetical protein [Pyrinomonadaceae bacterium]
NGESSVTKLRNPESSRPFEPITDRACERELNPSCSEFNIACVNLKKDHQLNYTISQIFPKIA